jgi:hypothetical protein
MTAESNVPEAGAGGTINRIWRCPACNRLLIERSIDYARQRHAHLLSRSSEFAREATWPAYLASMKRCRCGSKRELKPVPTEAVHGQLDLQTDAVVLQ